MYDEQESVSKSEDASASLTNGNSPDAFETDVAAQLAAFQPIRGEIEVTPSALRLGTCVYIFRLIIILDERYALFLQFCGCICRLLGLHTLIKTYLEEEASPVLISLPTC